MLIVECFSLLQRAVMSDFDRFKLMKAKQTVSNLCNSVVQCILYKYVPVMRAIWSFMDLLPKIHKTHIVWHHRAIFALLYVKCLWFKHIGLWTHTYIARFSLLIYYHSLFYSLHGATIVTSYSDVNYYDSTSDISIKQ